MVYGTWLISFYWYSSPFLTQTAQQTVTYIRSVSIRRNVTAVLAPELATDHLHSAQQQKNHEK